MTATEIVIQNRKNDIAYINKRNRFFVQKFGKKEAIEIIKKRNAEARYLCTTSNSKLDKMNRDEIKEWTNRYDKFVYQVIIDMKDINESKCLSK